MVTVWGRRNSLNVQKAVWALDEAGVPFERLDAGGEFGLLDTESYGRLNPNRRIPTLIDGDTVVWESNAVTRYVAAKWSDGDLWPADPAARALADMWMDWVQTTVIGPLIPVFCGPGPHAAGPARYEPDLGKSQRVRPRLPAPRRRPGAPRLCRRR